MDAAFDRVSAAEAFGMPGIDPRRWCCYGVVAKASDTQKSVVFTDDNGGPLPYPVVNVDLQPSGETVPCRVGYHVAGNQEGEWWPFTAGDEVVVLIPMGDENHQPVIVARCNQSLDVFPPLVAGLDTTQNNLAFKRTMAPYVFETIAPYLVRNATTGSFFTIDKGGDIYIANGNNNVLHVGSDWAGLQLGDATTMMQLVPATLDGTHNGQVFLQGNACQLLLDDAAAFLMTPGTLAIVTAGGGCPAQHAVSTEQVVALIEGYFSAFATLFASPPLGTMTITTAATFAAMLATLVIPATKLLGAAAIPLAATLPLGTDLALISTALMAPPAPGPALTALIPPGIGRAGLTL